MREIHFPAGRPQNTCPEGWRAFGGSCYLLVETPANYNTSVSVCSSEGTTLVSIGNSEENDFLKEL